MCFLTCLISNVLFYEVIGKIGKTGGKISFLVRMASVATGENKIKVDEDDKSVSDSNTKS